MAGRSYVDARNAGPRSQRMSDADERAGGEDGEASNRHAGDVQLVSQSCFAGEISDHDRSDQQRQARNRIGSWLDGRGIPRVRLRVSIDGDAAQAARRRAVDPQADVYREKDE